MTGDGWSDASRPITPPTFSLTENPPMTTLLAVTGLSPAVVTETLWALAHSEPAIIPNRIEFITTLTGAIQLEKQLFSPLPEWHDSTVWETLRHRLQAGPDQLIAQPPRIIHHPDTTTGRSAPLDDIISLADNHASAECIFAAVLDIVRDPKNQLIASIAGGRKTMGALLHSAVSLIGRESDRLTHVLVSSPFDTLPGFFFPHQPGNPLLDRQFRAFDPADARLYLTDVPFVPLRNRFKDLNDLPSSFHRLRDDLCQRLSRDADRPAAIMINHLAGRFSVDGHSYRVRPKAAALLEFILRCHLKKQVPADQNQAAAAFVKWHAKNAPRLGLINNPEKFDASDVRRELNHLRTVLKNATWQPAKSSFRQAPFTLEISDS